MPNQLIALVAQLNAKRASFESIRHSPGFGIAAKIMRGDAWDSGCVGVGFDKLPDNLLAQHFARDAVSAIYRTEHVTFRHAGWRCPGIDRHLHPGRHRRGADPAVLADQINDAPAAIALLQVRECERRDLRPSETAAEKNGENGSVAQSPECRDIRRAQKRLRLLL